MGITHKRIWVHLGSGKFSHSLAQNVVPGEKGLSCEEGRGGWGDCVWGGEGFGRDVNQDRLCCAVKT